MTSLLFKLWCLILIMLNMCSLQTLVALLEGVNSHVDLDHSDINGIRNRSKKVMDSAKVMAPLTYSGLTHQDSVQLAPIFICTLAVHTASNDYILLLYVTDLPFHKNCHN